MKHALFLLLLCTTTTGFAQQLMTIHGRIRDAETGSPLEGVVIVSKHSSKWGISDEEGDFELIEEVEDQVTLIFKLLGKQEKILTYTREALQSAIQVTLQNKDLRLEEVIVSAQKGSENSEIIMGEEVIQQVQAFSLNEVLEQLPGQATTNFDLNEFKPIAFRTARPVSVRDVGFGNKSFGTSIVIDDIPVSNNENMQMYAPNLSDPFQPNFIGFGDSGANDFNGYFSNANYGADLREISTENIESIEVVEGIPSVKYGDLTSGLVKIQRKAGTSPFKIYTAIKNDTYQYGFSKGFRVSDKIGYVNTSFSYVNSNKNPRSAYTTYNRINGNITWTSTNADKSLWNTLSADLSYNDDDVSDPENTEYKTVKNEKKSISLSNRLKWRLSGSAFDQLQVNASLNYADQFTHESKLVNSGGVVVGFGYEEGVYQGAYTPVSYYTVKAVEGIPVSSFVSADLYQSWGQQGWIHHMIYGVSARYSNNFGRGRLGSTETLDPTLTGGGSAVRPYNFGEEVHAEYQYAVYVEDHLSGKWNTRKVHVTGGLRVDNQNSFFTLSPRINASMSFGTFKIRGGTGLTSKAPSLNQIYTGPRYYDVVLADLRSPGNYNVGIVQTFIEPGDNKGLRPSRSWRSEVGFDYQFSTGELNVTGFYNRLYDGLTTQSYPIIRALADLDITYNDPEAPDYEVSGYTPYYYLQKQLVNKYQSTDVGLEVMFNLKKLPLPNFNFNLQASYTYTQNRDDVITYNRTDDINTPEKYGLIAPNDAFYTQLRLSGHLTYHLPKAGLVVAIRSEHFIIEDYDNDLNHYPYAYIDADLNVVSIPEEERQNEDLYGHIFANSDVQDRTLDKIYHNVNIRISKDLLNGFRFSFYANNFLDLKQTEMRYENGSYVKMIKPEMVQLSFGTTIEYEF